MAKSAFDALVAEDEAKIAKKPVQQSEKEPIQWICRNTGRAHFVGHDAPEFIEGELVNPYVIGDELHIYELDGYLFGNLTEPRLIFLPEFEQWKLVRPLQQSQEDVYGKEDSSI